MAKHKKRLDRRNPSTAKNEGSTELLAEDTKKRRGLFAGSGAGFNPPRRKKVLKLRTLKDEKRVLPRRTGNGTYQRINATKLQ